MDEAFVGYLKVIQIIIIRQKNDIHLTKTVHTNRVFHGHNHNVYMLLAFQPL